MAVGLPKVQKVGSKVFKTLSAGYRYSFESQREAACCVSK